VILLRVNLGLFLSLLGQVAGSFIRTEEPQERKEIQGKMMEGETLQCEGVLKRADTWKFFPLRLFTILTTTQSSSSSFLKQTSKCFNRLLPIHNYPRLTPTGLFRTPSDRGKFSRDALSKV